MYAWITGGSYCLQRFSDDGEPQGTAGKPVLDALVRRDLEQTAIVVTRYFGGTLLGTGGLSRAYGQAASRVVEAAGPITCRLCRRLIVTVGYAHLDRLRHALLQEKWWVGDPEFAIDVTFPVAVPPEQIEAARQLCADLTGGAALLELDELIYLPLPPPDPPPLSGGV